MKGALRVALFACAYNEVDGVANTCHQFEQFAQRRGLPFLNLHGGRGSYARREGSVERHEFQRRWPCFRLDEKHDYDLLFWRYYGAIAQTVRRFQPDIIHITGPSDVGQLGALLAYRLRIPLVAAWHTNVHEYAAKRFVNITRSLADCRGLAPLIERVCFRIVARFYQTARMLFAPNQELIRKLEEATGKTCHLMQRGVDTELFSPARRQRRNEPFTIGYVGRLTTEKNIHFLKDLERSLLERGLRDFRLLIVGQGAEEAWLRANLSQAEFAGVLQGEALARAYADMDVFAFPSRTDTFGNVVLEAMASGVPAVVTDGGGPKFIVQHGCNGFVARNDREFVEHTARLLSEPWRLGVLREAAREHALRASWDAVFEKVYAAYEEVLAEPQAAPWKAGALQPVKP